MANVLINDQYLTDIADAIRLKSGSTDTYKPKEMADAIKTISTAAPDELSIFDDLISKTYTGEFYSATAESIPSSYMASQPITMATGMKIETINNGAFYKCSKLVSANFPKVKVINNNAFKDCISLTEVSIPAVTTIYGQAFTNCESLVKLDFGYINAYITDINSPSSLDGCIKLTHLIIRSNKVIDIPFMPSQFKNNLDIAWIYVPAAYYNSYVARYNEDFSYGYTFRKIEDYPDICG